MREPGRRGRADLGRNAEDGVTRRQNGMKAGLVGLGVMGRNLALNLRDKGHEIFATDSWASAREWSAPGIRVVEDAGELAAVLGERRVILLMVKAGSQVDKEIANLVPHLASGDVIIDGGNSQYTDTERRAAELAARGIGYLGVGISGGAEGARHGAAMMAGGGLQDWETARGMLEPAAAVCGDGRLAISHFGTGGAGHFVKMVHNGIEYAIMQAIAECHGLMRVCAGLSADEISAEFGRWSTAGEGAGFLLEITAEIANTKDALTGDLLLPLIDDVAGQKGTGGWTVEAALKYGVAAPTIMEAVAARQVSGQREARATMATMPERASQVVVEPDFVAELERALVATMLVSLVQGVQIYAAAAREHDWRRDLGDVLRVWRAGSILRMRMLDEVAAVFDAHPDLDNGFAMPELASRLASYMPAWRRVVGAAVFAGYPTPVLSASLTYADALATTPLPTAMIQAQRDRFGAHGFRRTDRAGDFHGPWVQPDQEAEG